MVIEMKRRKNFCGAVGVSHPNTAGRSNGNVYEGVLLVTNDVDKLIPFVDQLLFSLRLLGFKTRPVTIRESAGVTEIEWSGRKPKAFRGPGAAGDFFRRARRLLSGGCGLKGLGREPGFGGGYLKLLGLLAFVR